MQRCLYELVFDILFPKSGSCIYDDIQRQDRNHDSELFHNIMWSKHVSSIVGVGQCGSQVILASNECLLKKGRFQSRGFRTILDMPRLRNVATLTANSGSGRLLIRRTFASF